MIKKDLSPEVKEALDAALELAQDMGDACASTAHYIFGLTRNHLSMGNRIFHDVKIYPEMFRDHLKKLPREAEEGDSDGFHPLVGIAIERGREAKRALGRGRLVSTDHALVGLLSLQDGSAYECLKEFSVAPMEIANEIIEALGFEISDCPAWD